MNTPPLTEDQKAELQKLAKIAAQARGSWYPPEVAEATEQFSALLNEYHKQGHSFTELGKASGLKWRSVKSRLARHGYLERPPSQKDKRYRGPLTVEDRQPECQHGEQHWRERRDKGGRLLRIECLKCRSESRKKS